MTLKSFVVFEGNGNNDGIQGRWETNYWYCKYVNQYVADYQYGNLKEVHIFSSSDNSVIDSSYFHNLPNDSTYIDYYNVETYHYYAPYLFMVDTIRVEFKNNLMYWYYVNNNQNYEKVK